MMLMLRPDLVDERWRALPPATYSLPERLVPDYPLKRGGQGYVGHPSLADPVFAKATCGVLVIAGRGRAFCAGNDITEMATLAAEQAEALARRQAALMARFATLPQVTLAAIDGHALGGGLMLAVAQDLRIASDRARFGLPEVTLGFNPAYGIARLLDVVGGAHARDLLLTGRIVHASEALRLGLVNRVVAAPTLEATAAAWAADVARSPRGGLEATKAIVAELRRPGRGAEPEASGAPP